MASTASSILQDAAYGSNVEAYVKYSALSHGSDGALFLDRFFRPAVEKLNGHKVLDIGCGAGTWSIHAAKEGGKAYGIDIQPGMVEAAKLKVKEANMEDKVSISVGDASALEFEDSFFDREISICVTCNLPEGIYEKSFKEVHRTLKDDGVAVIGIPYSLDVVFTNGSTTAEKVKQHINEVLASLPDDPEQEIISATLSELTEVLSATFYVKDGRLTLVTNENDLKEGQKIWRKLPKPIVPNRFHSKEAYRQAFKDSKLKVDAAFHPHFKNEEERKQYNVSLSKAEQLGSEYEPILIKFLST